MQDLVTVTGIVLSSSPAGEYDRRLAILTKERGKITAFAKGARRQHSRLLAACNLFAFGQFTLYPGRSAYTLTEAAISQYFDELRMDYEGAYYGMYFLELCDYYSRENNDEKELLKLLYQSLKALTAESIPRPLVQVVFELKAMMINGEFPGMPEEGVWKGSTDYTVHFIEKTGIEKLYTFKVSEEVLKELQQIAAVYRKRYIDREMKSLEMLSML
ncbi:MAG: DNA repair protein RecO [Lachnospiraceae bacterium]